MSAAAFELKRNSIIASQIAAAVKSGRVVHAYAFIGGSPEDRNSLALWLASYMLCKDPGDGPCGSCISCQKIAHGNHEDVIFVRKPEDRESIVRTQILELIDRLSFKPFGSRYVAVIEDAQLMNAASQNKLLKTLEEPVSDAVMILLADSSEGLLPTVLSRCSCFYLQDADAQYSAAAGSIADQFIGLVISDAPFYRKKAALAPILEDKDDARAKAAEFLDALEQKLEQKLTKEQGIMDAAACSKLINTVKQAETSRKYIKQLHSAAYTLKQFCLRV